MTSAQQILLDFFVLVAQREKGCLAGLSAWQSFRVDEQGWTFALPDLFAYLQKGYPDFLELDYKQFRQLLFDAPVNALVKQHGAELFIADNQQNVDRSCYQLRWLI